MLPYYPDDYPEKGGQNLKEEEKQEQHKKSGSIIIHHYIYLYVSFSGLSGATMISCSVSMSTYFIIIFQKSHTTY